MIEIINNTTLYHGSKYVFSQKCAGYLMLHGFVLLDITPSDVDKARSLFVFRETEIINKAIYEYKLKKKMIETILKNKIAINTKKYAKPITTTHGNMRKVFSQRCAGYLMLNGFSLNAIEPSTTDANKKTFLFRETQALNKCVDDYKFDKDVINTIISENSQTTYKKVVVK